MKTAKLEKMWDQNEMTTKWNQKGVSTDESAILSIGNLEKVARFEVSVLYLYGPALLTK